MNDSGLAYGLRLPLVAGAALEAVPLLVEPLGTAVLSLHMLAVQLVAVMALVRSVRSFVEEVKLGFDDSKLV